MISIKKWEALAQKWRSLENQPSKLQVIISEQLDELEDDSTLLENLYSSNDYEDMDIP